MTNSSATGAPPTASQSANSQTRKEIRGNPSWEQAEKFLNSWEDSIGLPALKRPTVENEAIRLLELSPDEIRRLTPEEAAWGWAVVIRYAAYLSRCHQQEEAKASWAREMALRIISNGGLFTGYGEVAVLAAIRSHPEAAAYDSIRVESQTKGKRLAFMAKWVGDIARTLEAQSTKYYNKA